MQNHIRRISSRHVHSGRLVTLREDTVLLPRGTEAYFERVDIKHGASTLAIEENLDVWLVREWKYAVDRPSLEVVSGGIERGESPLEAAHRELREEVGLTAEHWTPMGYVDPFTSMVFCPNYMFVARGLTQVGHDHEEGEAIELVRVPLDEAVRLVMAGEITHGTSAVLVLKAAAWMKAETV